MSYSIYYPSVILEGLRKTTKIIGQDSRFPDRLLFLLELLLFWYTVFKHDTRGVKEKKTFHQHARVGTAGATVLVSTASSRATSYVRMRTTVKHHAAGTVKRTVPYKDFCIFFMNWGMATDIKLNIYILYKYKEKIKEKRNHYIICYR
jgi:hypothetical protein